MERILNDYEYIVIGAGPSGLAFASTLHSTNTLVIDSGQPVHQRDRDNPKDCVKGAGGAGLFSDGKFSFFPAGTHIWKGDPKILKKAYHSLERLLSEYGEIPSFPSSSTYSLCEGSWCLKSYPSIYIGLDERIDLIHKLVSGCSEIRYETEYLSHRKHDGSWVIRMRDLSDGRVYEASAENLVFAGGRFMPLYLNLNSVFRRYEFGVRISGPADLFEKKISLNDPKYIFLSNGIEYRTFCWCDRGEVVATDFNGIRTFSGRADIAPTGTTNFGFNIRVKDPLLLNETEFRSILSIPEYQVSIGDFDEILKKEYPFRAAEMFRRGLDLLFEKFNTLLAPSIRITGPTVEGVGCYPLLDSRSALVGEPSIFVLGDSSGIYRGIVPSMLSGYKLAHAMNKRAEKKVLFKKTIVNKRSHSLCNQPS